MAKSKDGTDLKVGDKVWVPCEVTKVNGEFGINLTMNTALPCPNSGQPTNMTLGAGQVFSHEPKIQKFSFDQATLTGYAKHAINVLQGPAGSAAVDLIKVGFEGWKAVSGRDFAGLFAALNDGKKDVNAIVAAIKAEFSLT